MKKIAKSIANSPLVKTAIAGGDANWGRIAMAIGKTLEDVDRSKISINTETKEEAENLFRGLSTNGEVEVPFNESENGINFGMLRDQYEIVWMINFKTAK